MFRVQSNTFVILKSVVCLVYFITFNISLLYDILTVESAILSYQFFVHFILFDISLYRSN